MGQSPSETWIQPLSFCSVDTGQAADPSQVCVAQHGCVSMVVRPGFSNCKPTFTMPCGHSSVVLETPSPQTDSRHLDLVYSVDIPNKASTLLFV